MEALAIFIPILFFSAFAFIANKSQVDKCNIFVFTASLYLTGFLFCLVTEVSAKGFRPVPANLWGLSLIAGVASVGGFLSQLSALKAGGKLPIINIIGNLSSLIPIVYSLVFFNEKTSLTKMIGICLFVLFIFMLNWAGKEEAV